MLANTQAKSKLLCLTKTVKLNVSPSKCMAIENGIAIVSFIH